MRCNYQRSIRTYRADHNLQYQLFPDNKQYLQRRKLERQLMNPCRLMPRIDSKCPEVPAADAFLRDSVPMETFPHIAGTHVRM